MFIAISYTGEITVGFPDHASVWCSWNLTSKRLLIKTLHPFYFQHIILLVGHFLPDLFLCIHMWEKFRMVYINICYSNDWLFRTRLILLHQFLFLSRLIKISNGISMVVKTIKFYNNWFIQFFFSTSYHSFVSRTSFRLINSLTHFEKKNLLDISHSTECDV